MLSQSLLFCDWRDCAAPPDSSASSQALITDGSRPVLAARREANCCWSLVSVLWAPAGSVAPPVPAVVESPTPGTPVVSPAAPMGLPDCCAWARTSAKLEALEPAVPTPLVPAAFCEVAAAIE